MIAPFPWFGGKRLVADVVWRRFGDVKNYVEPFFGSGAVLLGRPHAPRTEIVNDLDGFAVNFWRAVQADPEAVATHADWPVYESDLHARHAWLLDQRASLTARLEGDPNFFDAQIAGWWVWGVRIWIGSGWCFGDGPWHRADGMLVKRERETESVGIYPSYPRHLQEDPASQQGVHRKIPKISHIGGATHASFRGGAFNELSDRLRSVRIICGDWARIMTPAVTWQNGLTGVLLDPPYAHEDRESGLYIADGKTTAAAVRAWALANGGNPLMRIALCGYEGDHEMPGWTLHRWKAHGGYGNQRDDGSNGNAARETIWFSPHCLAEARYETGSLFGEAAS